MLAPERRAIAAAISELGTLATTATKPRVWTVFVAYLIAFQAMSVIGILVAVVILMTALRSTGGAALSDPKAVKELLKTASTEPWMVLVSAMCSALVLGGVALTAAKLSPVAISERLRLGRGRGGKRWLAVPPLAGLAALTAGGAVGGALELVVGRQSDALIGIENAVRSHGLTLAMTFVIFAGTTPLAEELFFRGYAQTRLVARYGRGAGIFIATALFALLHMDPMHVVLAFPIGVVLAWTTERTGSIWAAVIAHSVNNGLFVASAQATRSPPGWATVVNLGLVAVAALFGIAYLTPPVPTG